MQQRENSSEGFKRESLGLRRPPCSRPYRPLVDAFEFVPIRSC